MKRRVFLTSSVIGASALSGCMGLFSDGEDPTETDQTPTSNEDITPPYEELGSNSIPIEFLNRHFQTLSEQGGFTVSYTSQLESGSNREIEWKRSDGRGYRSVSINSDIVEEQYYSGDYVGINEPDQNSGVNILERSLPPVESWANATVFQNVIEGGRFSIDSETESEVVYAGILENEDSDRGVTIHISKNRPIITEIAFTDSQEAYELTEIGSTTVVEPNWFTEALQNNVIVTGGVYEDGESLIIQTDENSSPIQQGSLINIIQPNGESSSINVTEEITSGESVYIVFQDNEPYYSVDQLPPISNRDSLESGTYIIRGISPDGEQQFEVQLISNSSSN